jgi:hypothetical protein
MTWAQKMTSKQKLMQKLLSGQKISDFQKRKLHLNWNFKKLPPPSPIPTSPWQCNHKGHPLAITVRLVLDSLRRLSV